MPSSRQRLKYKLLGVCQSCGHEIESESKSSCNRCLERIRKYNKTNEGKIGHSVNRNARSKSAYGLWRRIKDTSKQRGIEFNLNEEDIIIPTYCPLLEIKLEWGGSRYNSPSVDRIDNTKGYTKDNIWVISELANRMKNTASIEQLIIFSKNAIDYFGSY